MGEENWHSCSVFDGHGDAPRGMASAVLFWNDKLQHGDSSWGNTAYTALGIARLEIVRLLSSGQVHPDADISQRQVRTALMVAAIAGNEACVQLLVEMGASPDVQDFEGNTALHLAAQERNVGVCRLLLRAGAKQSLRNKMGKTALGLAEEDNDFAHWDEEEERDIVDEVEKRRNTRVVSCLLDSPVTGLSDR